MFEKHFLRAARSIFGLALLSVMRMHLKLQPVFTGSPANLNRFLGEGLKPNQSVKMSFCAGGPSFLPMPCSGVSNRQG
jgi:hypothetical protein